MDSVPVYTYDKEVDILYISFSPGEKATTGIELNEHILLRLNHAEKRAIGLTLMDFSILVQMTNVGPRQFPLSGLQDLEPEWQEMVMDILTTPPVNRILNVSMYTASSDNTVPIALVNQIPLSTVA